MTTIIPEPEKLPKKHLEDSITWKDENIFEIVDSYLNEENCVLSINDSTEGFPDKQISSPLVEIISEDTQKVEETIFSFSIL